jgi:hypothetical protein
MLERVMDVKPDGEPGDGFRRKMPRELPPQPDLEIARLRGVRRRHIVEDHADRGAPIEPAHDVGAPRLRRHRVECITPDQGRVAAREIAGDGHDEQGLVRTIRSSALADENVSEQLLVEDVRTVALGAGNHGYELVSLG